MKRLVFSDRSLQDLEGILGFIARDKPRAAIRFVELIQRQCEALCDHPHVDTLREDLAPQLRLFSFRSYGIYFRNLNDRVRVDRVLHGAINVVGEHFEQAD